MLASQLSTEGVEEGGGECQKNNAQFPQEEAKFKLVIESKEKGQESRAPKVKVYTEMFLLWRDQFLTPFPALNCMEESPLGD